MHTLRLLSQTTTRLLAKLPSDGSEQLRALVQACNPLKTLDELSAATRIAPPQLALLASHLVYWGYARIIRTITLRSIYAVRGGMHEPPPAKSHPKIDILLHHHHHHHKQVKPSAPTHLGALPAMAFEQRFPPHNFFRVLTAFGAGKPLQALLEGLPEVCVVELGSILFD